MSPLASKSWSAQTSASCTLSTGANELAHEGGRGACGLCCRRRHTAPQQGHAPQLAARPPALFGQRDAESQQGDHHRGSAAQNHVQAVNGYYRVGGVGGHATQCWRGWYSNFKPIELPSLCVPHCRKRSTRWEGSWLFSACWLI